LREELVGGAGRGELVEEDFRRPVGGEDDAELRHEASR
jgi:hypothetical protein